MVLYDTLLSVDYNLVNQYRQVSICHRLRGDAVKIKVWRWSNGSG